MGHRSIILIHSKHDSRFWQHLRFSLLICKVKCLHTDSYINVQLVLTRLLWWAICENRKAAAVTQIKGMRTWRKVAFNFLPSKSQTKTGLCPPRDRVKYMIMNSCNLIWSTNASLGNIASIKPACSLSTWYVLPIVDSTKQSKQEVQIPLCIMWFQDSL